jgi:hypothetical protein
MMHSLSLYPMDVNITESNQPRYGNIISKIIESKEFNKFIDAAISHAEKAGLSSIDKPYTGRSSIEFKAGDLHTAIGGTHQTYLKGNKDDKGGWDLNVNITDSYDFELKAKQYKNDGTFTAVNNAALFSQGCRVISKYKINVNFNHKRRNARQ